MSVIISVIVYNIYGERERKRISLCYHSFQRLGLQFGEVIEVTIKDVRDFGFKVEVAPGSNLLLHISQLSYDFVSL